MKNLFIISILLLLFSACTGDSKKETTEKEETKRDIPVPSFNQDKAYQFVVDQVEFGPRVPNTEPHRQTEEYLVNQLNEFGAKVTRQKFEAETYDGEIWNLTNIIGSILPEKKRRILLAAHWDTRKIADKDTERTNEPIDGANDGASGVAVVLEILRTIQQAEVKPEIGIDIIFFDGEDNGMPHNTGGDPDWWCLGSQYWSKNKHVSNYSAYYGILFDMVGGVNAQFYKEGFSMKYAPGIVNKVWNAAERTGYGNYFFSGEVDPITDDHYYVNEYGKIPMIDIIAHDPLSNHFFPDFHHTHDDNMDIISQETLKAVGQTALQVIYEEKGR
ncbi:M28 family peptidase [Marivirga sp. S37H4]|uniref:M28 family peptidase n=1 Tax=Marivirga aurantiaca TaxID=2802615 RepID=A0A934WYF7_9BACT|nr:M28 family peptidase [Marivirga aurantiaca]MBK6265488.1 M28 family peptidase [Marivirga aurantiaca]